MTLSPYLILGAISVIGILLAVLGRNPRRTAAPRKDELDILGDVSSRHATHLPQIRQALESEDFAYVSSLGREELAQRLRKDRFRIALDYLPALRQDFDRLIHLAGVITVLSPEVAAAQEWERFHLKMRFRYRYHLIRLGMLCGMVPLFQLVALNQMVSAFSMRIETAMKELGERAALATELASSMDRRSVGTV
jgi:hypothetical protein